MKHSLSTPPKYFGKIDIADFDPGKWNGHGAKQVMLKNFIIMQYLATAAIRSTAILTLAFGSLASAGYAHAEPILSASTETHTEGERNPSPELLNAVLTHSDANDVSTLAQCMTDMHIPKSSRTRLFRSVALPRIREGERIYFLRPALEPYCFTFYGAHLFRYWLIAENESVRPKTYSIRFEGVGDSFEVLPKVTNANYDIAETSCTVSQCSTAWMRFNGKEYVSYRCSERRYTDDGKTVEHDYPCRE